jgi:saccharopine dehydrogenase (NAD+, L-lysine-forming)
VTDGGQSRSRSWLLYGAYGFTGELIARLAAARGLAPVLAGRSHARTEALARELELPYRVFPLDDADGAQAGIDGMGAVLHAAGPFAGTYRPMTEACLRSGCHYLDITGEIEVLEGVFSLDQRARDAGVVLLPGVGFDVVPTDCAAVEVARRVAAPTHLDIAFTVSGRPSTGTLKGMVEGLARPGTIRRAGQLVDVPHGQLMRSIPFTDRTRDCVSIPWGDLSTAWVSTGIPDIRVFSPAPRALRRMSTPLQWIARRPLARRAAQAMLDRLRGGPDDTELASGAARVWAEAWNDDGQRAWVELTLPNAYAFTADSACTAVTELLGADYRGPPAGALTPAMAFGSDFVGRMAGVRWSPSA